MSRYPGCSGMLCHLFVANVLTLMWSWLTEKVMIMVDWCYTSIVIAMHNVLFVQYDSPVSKIDPCLLQGYTGSFRKNVKSKMQTIRPLFH